MTFAISFDELSEIANTYTREASSEELDVETHPLADGILIHIKKFDTGSITLRGKLALHFESYENGILTIRLKFKNFFYELIKKVLMGIVLKIVMRKLKQQEDTDEIDPTKFIHFGSSTISAEINNLCEAMKIPIELILVKQKVGSIAIAFNFLPDRLLEDPAEVPE
ncbi:MAG: hypothetical protein ACNS60_01305 [Candidatus Cyclobacteriaceae bacterium M2_1C_046]